MSKRSERMQAMRHACKHHQAESLQDLLRGGIVSMGERGVLLCLATKVRAADCVRAIFNNGSISGRDLCQAQMKYGYMDENVAGMIKTPDEYQGLILRSIIPHTTSQAVLVSTKSNDLKGIQEYIAHEMVSMKTQAMALRYASRFGFLDCLNALLALGPITKQLRCRVMVNAMKGAHFDCMDAIFANGPIGTYTRGTILCRTAKILGLNRQSMTLCPPTNDVVRKILASGSVSDKDKCTAMNLACRKSLIDAIARDDLACGLKLRALHLRSTRTNLLRLRGWCHPEGPCDESYCVVNWCHYEGSCDRWLGSQDLDFSRITLRCHDNCGHQHHLFRYQSHETSDC